MSTGTEDFEKLRKLLTLKRYEQPPPGYFSRFSGLVINRLEREGSYDASAQGGWAEVPWLNRLWRMFESSPVASGAFASAVCAVAIFGIAAANQVDKTTSTAYTPVTGGAVDGNVKGALALNTDAPSDVFGRSTDSLIASNSLSSPFAGNSSMTARMESVSFTTAHQ